MCTSSDKEGEWQRGIPDSPGDWLYVEQWECGCVIRSGIAYVFDYELKGHNRIVKLPNELNLSWEGQEVNLDAVSAWRKILLPNFEEEE